MSKLEHSRNDREMSSMYGIPCTYRGALHRHGDHMFAAAEVMKVRFAPLTQSSSCINPRNRRNVCVHPPMMHACVCVFVRLMFWVPH